MKDNSKAQVYASIFHEIMIGRGMIKANDDDLDDMVVEAAALYLVRKKKASKKKCIVTVDEIVNEIANSFGCDE